MDGPTQDTLAERLTLVSDIARDLLGARKPSEVVTRVFDRLSAHLGLEVYLNYLATDDGSAPRLDSCAGVPPDIEPAIQSLDLGGTLCGAAFSQGAPIVAED